MIIMVDNLTPVSTASDQIQSLHHHHHTVPYDISFWYLSYY